MQVWREVAEGDAVLPAEPELASLLGVSRPHLREVLVGMEREGLISRRRGGKTVVNQAALEIAGRFDEQWDFAELLRTAGFEADVEVLSADELTLDPARARLFGVPTGAAAVEVVKRWRADGAVVRVTQDVVPFERGTDLELARRASSIFDVLDAVLDEQVEWELAIPTAVLATGQLARWIEVDRGSPLLQVEGIGVSRTGRRVLLSSDFHLPGAVRLGFIRIRQN